LAKNKMGTDHKTQKAHTKGSKKNQQSGQKRRCRLQVKERRKRESRKRVNPFEKKRSETWPRRSERSDVPPEEKREGTKQKPL